MAIDLSGDILLSLREAAQRLGGVTRSTIHRWHKSGIQGVRLELVRVGGKRKVTLRALEAFIGAVTAATESGRGGAE